jgi:ribonuclease D
MAIYLHHGDLPDTVRFTDSVAVDSETMGLHLHRDRLCLVQLSAGNGDAHLVRIIPGTEPNNLKALFTDPTVTKIFHFARFDVAKIKVDLGVDCAPVYCTKIVSKLCRTNTDRHGLKNLCFDLLGVSLSKEQQTSDWGADTFSAEQQQYAANDVLYLHDLKVKLDALLEREGRHHLAEACFDFLPTRCALDIAGWDEQDIFTH